MSTVLVLLSLQRNVCKIRVIHFHQVCGISPICHRGTGQGPHTNTTKVSQASQPRGRGTSFLQVILALSIAHMGTATVLLNLDTSCDFRCTWAPSFESPRFRGLKARSRKAMGSVPCMVRTGLAGYIEMFITQAAKHSEVSHFPKAGVDPPGRTCYLGTGSPLAPCSPAWNSWQVAQVNSGKDSKAKPGLSSMRKYRAATRTRPLQNCFTAKVSKAKFRFSNSLFRRYITLEVPNSWFL